MLRTLWKRLTRVCMGNYSTVTGWQVGVVNGKIWDSQDPRSLLENNPSLRFFGKKFQDSKKVKQTMQKRDLKTYQKHFQYFKRLPKFSKTQIFRGAIHRPCKCYYSCTNPFDSRRMLQSWLFWHIYQSRFKSNFFRLYRKLITWQIIAKGLRQVTALLIGYSTK